ncbi:LCP family protein [Listeria booriae]|uniref:LCP family protein n=1 Tax=Listeria booriae TaxID=1552123 RepID=A0A7X0XCB3_9LIST|nr:LCP family protein [Listeria booriae]MBC1491590.1 LCP family protein [Listeria booriae]MBC1502319.1 LCP family protein [Listeria booriae]MBC1523387.1 LCP family protein [Listeria booriae]MBC1529834.1 LCP family protein [Listeria booriae]
MPINKSPAPRSAKYKRRRLVLFLVLVPLMLIVLAGAGYATFLFSSAKLAVDNSYDNVRSGEASSLRDKDVDPIKDSFSFLIIGVDDSTKRQANNGGNPRSDALILATLNVEDNKLEMTSIPRDSYVHIQSDDNTTNRYTKINAAHAVGGPELTMKTVEDLFKVPVDYYIRFNFDAFLEIVDALNGVDVDVPVDFTEQDSNDKAGAITLKKGKQTLNGEQALALSRTRHIDNDIERGKRQQLVMKAIIDKATSIGSINKYSDVIKAVGDNMKTNMTFSQMLSIAKYGMTNDIDMKSLALNGEDAPQDGVYYYQLDENSVESVANEFASQLKGVNKPFPNAMPYSEENTNQ